MRVDKTLSELHDLLDSTWNERLSTTARMAVDAIKKLQEENELLNAEKELLQAKWEAQGLMIQKLHEENRKYKTALEEIERWDKMLYSTRELGNFAKRALGILIIPLKD